MMSESLWLGLLYGQNWGIVSHTVAIHIARVGVFCYSKEKN